MVKAKDSLLNWKVICYAGVLLMPAEALNENGKSTKALGYVNEVCTRAGLKAYSTLSKDDTP